MYGNPLPWKVTPQTPNLAKTDETDDMRPGLGWSGLEHLQEFVRKGGLLITANDTTNFAVTFGFAPGVSIAAAPRLKVTGSALRSKMVDAASPIVYGYSTTTWRSSLRIRRFSIFRTWQAAEEAVEADAAEAAVAASVPPGAARPTIRIFRRAARPSEIPEEPHCETWEAAPLTDEQLRNPVNVIPPAARPRVVLRYANAIRSAGLRAAR